MKKALERISRITEWIEKTIIGGAILLMMINSVANAIGRYVFDRSIYFSEELNQFLIVWITFIGFAFAVRKGRNIRMTALYDALGYKAQKTLAIVITLVTAALMFYLAYQAFFYVQDIQKINRLSSALQFPVYIVYAIIPLGLAMAGVQYLIGFLMNITHQGIYASFETMEKSSPSTTKTTQKTT